MLRYLQIRDFAIVDALEIELSGGFTCITGETGAGKSILVGALGLLCGDRADTSTIRGGAKRAELTAGFEVPQGSPARTWLEEAELDSGDDCLLRRVINENGRSRAWINGTAVTLQQLAELGEHLVEIHGQNEHLRLARSDEQFRLLDGGGDYSQPLEELAARYRVWRELAGERRELLAEKPLDAGERDLLEYQLQELESDMLAPQAFEELESEHRVLARGGDILAALEQACEVLDGESGGAGAALHRTVDRLERHAALDPEIEAARALLREAAINCDEALASIHSAQARLDHGPERLQELERQLTAQHDLARKHRVEPEGLPAVLEGLRTRLQRAETLEGRLGELERQLEQALEAYRAAAGTVHDHRRRHAGELSASVTGLMQQLGMEGGVFEIRVEFDPEHSPSARGGDRLDLQVSANPGIAPGPLRKVASGGELSRISLAIKVASSGGAGATQVFDEVDAGIGGETAHAVGALIHGLASEGQALCVTHLAQVAVFADRQLQVRKSADADGARVRTRLLQEEERVDEIARMLGGRLSEQSRAHASELLATASVRH